MKAQDNNIINIDIPADMPLNDRILLLNKSPYTIIKAVAVLDNEVLGNANFVRPNAQVEMASFTKKGLRKIVGKKIQLKVKGVKKVIGTEGVYSSKRTTEEDLNDIDPSLITYDFSATIFETHHDLHITITDLGDKPLDF